MDKPLSAKEFRKHIEDEQKFGFTFPGIIDKMLKDFAQQWVEYTKHQCAEKAIISKEYLDPFLPAYQTVDKQSILNAVKSEEVI